MATKANRETDNEKLDALKRKLRAEIKAQEQIVDQDLTYLYQNVGGLMVGAVLNSAKEALPAGLRMVLSPLLGRGEHHFQKEEQTKSSKLMQLFNDFLPVIAEIALPFVLQAGMSFLKKKILKK